MEAPRIAIGDIHGNPGWKKFLERTFSEFYFVGDYFDNYEETSTASQVRNFLDIVRHAREDPRIKMCLGNHDFQYLRGLDFGEKYSGYQHYGFWDIQIALEGAMDIIKPVHVTEDNYIISHAGVTKTFLQSCNLSKPEEINQRFLEYRMCLAFCGIDQYGDDVENTPIWVRPKSLLRDKLDGYKQIVGHTRVQQIHTIEDVTFIDLGNNLDVFEF